MTRKRHPRARTNPKIRREIQQSGESNSALAVRLGLNPKTIAKWHGRKGVSDAPMGPKHPVSSVLNSTDEALIVIFRRHTRLALNDCLAVLRWLIPHLSRSALHRCLRRYRVNRIPWIQRRKLSASGEQARKRRFSIQIHIVSSPRGKYLYTAISDEGDSIVAAVREEANGAEAAAFLAYVLELAPVEVREIETNNYRAFVNSEAQPRDSKRPAPSHPFHKVCLDNNIAHCITKSENPAPKIVSRGWRKAARSEPEKALNSRPSLPSIWGRDAP